MYSIILNNIWFNTFLSDKFDCQIYTGSGTDIHIRHLTMIYITNASSHFFLLFYASTGLVTLVPVHHLQQNEKHEFSMAIVAICGTKSLTMPPNHDNNNLFPPLLIEK